MLNWSALEPARFERAVQQLLRASSPGMVSIDGAGGDGGMDSQLRSADGRTVFEIKSFSDRLTNPRRRQIEKSLQAASMTTPDMRRWVLVIPLNPTRGELAWFEGKLQDIAGDAVELEWCGRDWLDGQVTANPAFRRYVEGPHSEVAKAVAELHMGQAVLANGAQDLFVRNRAIQEQVDSLSMNWTADWAVEGKIQTVQLRAKHPDAALVDPVHLKPTFTFDPQDENAQTIRQQLETVINFGGQVTVTDEFLTNLSVDASDEVKLLLCGIEGPGTLTLTGETKTLEPPVRTTVEMTTLVDPDSPIAVDVWFRTSTAGALGISLSGSDPAGAVEVILRLPHPNLAPEERAGPGASFDVSFKKPWKFPARDVLPALRLQAALQIGGRVSLRVHGLAAAWTDVEPGEGGDLDYPALVRLAKVVVHLEDELGVRLRLPNDVTYDDLRMAEALAATFAQDLVEAPFDTLTAHVTAVEPFLAQFPGERFALHTGRRDFTLPLGDLDVDFGPVAIWMPHVKIANRDELEADYEADEPVVRFKTVEQPAYFRSREYAATIDDPDEDEAS